MSLFDAGPSFGAFAGRLTEFLPGLYKRLLDMCRAGNQLDETNFPNGLPGTVINEGTLPGSAIMDGTLEPEAPADHTLPLRKLTVRETHLGLVLLADAWSTISTGFVDASGYLRWDPAVFAGLTEVRLEVTGWVANASATATFQLIGAAAIGSVTTQATSRTRIRSGALTMPQTAQDLWVQVKTSSASYAAYLLAARLILVH